MLEHSKKKIKYRLKNPKRFIIFILSIILLIIIIGMNNNKIKKKDNISFIVNNQDITNQLENEIIIKENIQYISFNDIKKCIDPNAYQEDELIITGSDKKICALELNKNQIDINGSKIELQAVPFKTEGGIIYLPFSEMQNVYDMEVLYIKEYKNILVDSYSKKIEKATIKRNLMLKEKMKQNSANIEKLKKGDIIIYISEENDWAKVRTQNGNIGYLKKNKLKDFIIEREDLHQTETVSSNISYYEKNITKENIEKYNNRKKVIEEIIEETVNKKKKAVKIIYKKEKDTDIFKRFQLEATAFLKECGISIIFE